MVTKVVIDLKKYFVLELLDIITLNIFTKRLKIGQFAMSQRRQLELNMAIIAKSFFDGPSFIFPIEQRN